MGGLALVQTASDKRFAPRFPHVLFGEPSYWTGSTAISSARWICRSHYGHYFSGVCSWGAVPVVILLGCWLVSYRDSWIACGLHSANSLHQDGTEAEWMRQTWFIGSRNTAASVAVLHGRRRRRHGCNDYYCRAHMVAFSDWLHYRTCILRLMTGVPFARHLPCLAQSLTSNAMRQVQAAARWLRQT
jgi:hypothetical protein